MRAETGELISMSGADGAPVATAPAAPHAAAAPAPAAPPPRWRFDLAVLPAMTRAAQIAATLDTAFADAGFRDSIAQADAARDQGDWAAAEGAYGAALNRHPLHWGYCIQYAHTIKEQGLFIRAEAWYRSAVALGAPAEMVDQHLAFVARANGADFVRKGSPRLAVAPLLAPPTVHDIRLLGELTQVRGMADEDLVLDLMRTMPDNRAVLLQMIARPEFARANRLFLEILQG
jgi:hypothetical protein